MAQTSKNLQEIKQDKNSPAVSENAGVASPGRLQQIEAGIAHFFTTHYWLLCLLVGSVALGFNLYRLGAPSMWFDEILSVERARQSLPVLLQIIANTQPNMALYYVLLHFWLGVTSLLGFNPTEVVVRLPSAIFAALSSVMVFLLGRRFLGMVAGLVGAGVYLLNDLQLVYAQETRSYALQLLLICISWYALLAIFETEGVMNYGPYSSISGRSQKRWWICYGVVSVLAVYTQLFSALILVAQVVYYVGLLFLPGPWRDRVRQQFRSFLICLGGVFIASLPLLYASRHGSKTGWLPIPQPGDIYTLFLNISANSRIYLYLLVALCLLGLLIAFCAYWPGGVRLLGVMNYGPYARIKNGDDPRLSRFQRMLPVGLAMLCWVIVPVVLSYIISHSSTRLFSSRYLVTIVPPLVLLVGMGVVVVRWRLIQVVLALSLLLLAFHYVPLYYDNAQAEDWNTTSFWLEHHYQPQDGLVCFDNDQGCQVCIEYYLTAYPSAAHFTADSPGSFNWVNYDLTNRLGNAESAVDPKALAAFGNNHPRIFYIVGRVSGSTLAQALSAQYWLDAHYHFLAQIVTKTVTIRLYGTT